MRNRPRELSTAERLDACGDALYHVSELRENIRDLGDLRVEGYDAVLGDLVSLLELIETALRVAVNAEAQEEADELRREYERGLL